MRILILANNDVGLYQFRKELIDELLKENEVFISLPYGEFVETLKEMGCEFISTDIDRRGINPKTDFQLFCNYRKILKKIMPDFVITYTIKPNVYGGIACEMLNIPYAINVTGLGTAFENGGLVEKIATFLNKAACKKAKKVFFENEANRQFFSKRKIVTPKQSYTLMGAGVNLKKYALMEYPDKGRTKFLFMGRVMAEKGIDELFEAMKRLVKEGMACELDVLGNYEEDYKGKIEKYQAEGWLHYFGYQKDVRPFINNCHCFILPSWHEGMANTNLESAASGRPVITTNIPGCKEAVKDGITGYICERKNAESLYKAIKKFLGLSYNERKNMGIAGRKYMEEKFDKRIVVQETLMKLELKKED